ncbi:carotenoid biosynthesis protein [Vicingaceae bacterium]|nr:carotenoid biosynthesis protein [Vicingaceae bacterium]
MNKLKIYLLSQKKISLIAVAILYLFHFTAIIGSGLGFQDWFISKTPLNLTLIGLLLVLAFPLNSKKGFLLFFIYAAFGIFVEYLGVNYGLLFGEYSYGGNLGPKFGGVPWSIGLNWALLVMITGELSNKFKLHKILKAIVASLLMVFLDFFMEHSAPLFDFWEFNGGIAPYSNYIAWFFVALTLQLIHQYSKLKGNYFFSLHCYLAQLIFFIFFYLN